MAFRKDESKMIKYDLKPLITKQKALDTLINNLHKVTYATTKEERFLALLVELGELANATRTFKYWSIKPGEGFERIIDEYADGLHFLLSLTLAYNFKVPVLEVSDTKNDLTLTHVFVESYIALNEFAAKKDANTLIDSLIKFLELGHKLGFTKQQIFDAYLAKLEVNYQRQKDHY